jgi:phage shock protein A
MNSQEPIPLTRGLFGYRRQVVDQIILDRDVMLRQAEARVRAAEDRAAELETEVGSLRDHGEAMAKQLEDLRTELEEMRAKQAEAAPPPPPADPARQITSEFLADELARILASAEESARRILERARGSSEQQITEADRMWREAQVQIGRFANWRDRVEPAIRSAHARIEDVRQRIEDVPGQIRAALAPLADAVAGLDVDLSQVTAVSMPPLLVAPGGLERHPVSEVPMEPSGPAPEQPAAAQGAETHPPAVGQGDP